LTPKDRASTIRLRNTVPGTVTLRRRGRNAWTVTQRHFGPEHDNNHNVTWLRIDNPGSPAEIEIRLKWAEWGWMQLRKHGYLRVGRKFELLQGEINPTSTTYRFTAPSGESCFGSTPWYTNEDADRFLKRTERRSPACRVRSIGTTGEGREIRCLTIDANPSDRKGNVLVIGREHAFESSGSFAVEATARFLLGKGAPTKWLRHYTFHLIPVINPDGVANGTKLTRMGPVKEFDLVQAALTSDDPTCKAVREEFFSLEPAVVLSHHTYLFHQPALVLLEKRIALAMLDSLISEDEREYSTWYVARSQTPFLKNECYRRFNTTVVATELPWLRRLPRDIEKMGVDVFKAIMKAHEVKKRDGGRG